MHFISDKSLRRPGWKYERAAGGGEIGYRGDQSPYINWKHIDGPLMFTSDHGLHWLTLWERIQMFFGWTDIRALDVKHQRGAYDHGHL